MFKETARILTRKLITLGFLIACLIFVASSDTSVQKAHAYICCDQCWINYDSCVEGCSSQACLDACESTFYTCYRHCDPFC